MDGTSVIITSSYLAVKMTLSLTFIRIQDAADDEDYESIKDNDALFVLAGDPAGEDEPMRKGTSFQVRLSYYFCQST